MAASTSPTSEWVSCYTDKKDDWVRARLEHLEGKEKLSLTGSTVRRKEIRALRVELRDRKEAALAAANPTTTNPASVQAEVSKVIPRGR